MNSHAWNQQSLSTSGDVGFINTSGDDFDEFATDSGQLSSSREVPAWLVSIVVHVAIILCLAMMTYSTGVDKDFQITSLLDDMRDEAYKFEDATVHDQIGNDSPTNMLSPSLAAAQNQGNNPQQKIEQQLQEEIIEIKLPQNVAVEQPPSADIASEVSTTGTTDHAGGVEGAMDRLTFEIAASLREQKTLAIWLLDASASVNKRREAIADRFENVYRQLGIMNVGSDKALKTAVASFGEVTKIMTDEPVDDVTEIAAAIRKIDPDNSGKENVFAAVNTVVDKWATYRTKMRRNMMVIIITDERGDDFMRLEETIVKLRNIGAKVYVAGNAAVFGREKGYVTWEYEDGFKEDLPVDQGPETVRPERLKLAYWGGTRSRDFEYMSSGYGPYALTRMCAETGGLYLVTDETRVRFDHAIMRNYTPDYRPIRMYDEDLTKNMAKAALVTVATKTWQGNVPMPQLQFEAPNDNVLRTQITEAQKPAAVLDYTLQELMTIMEGGEKDRAKLDTPRWRASYDLSMGRVLAMRARAFGYNTTLAEMKSSPKAFEKKGSNSWTLVPAPEINSGPQVKKLAQKAAEYLTRVIDEHPGTPWAMEAERELSQAMGWSWKEGTITLASEGMRANENNDPKLLLAEEERKRQEAMKKKQVQRVKPIL